MVSVVTTFIFCGDEAFAIIGLILNRIEITVIVRYRKRRENFKF
jgi:hypothetical protein